MSSDKGTSETGSWEQLKEQNEMLSIENRELKHLVVDMYHAFTTGQVLPLMPASLLGIMPTALRQTPFPSAVFKDPQYHPNFPHYYDAKGYAKTNTLHLHSQDPTCIALPYAPAPYSPQWQALAPQSQLNNHPAPRNLCLFPKNRPCRPRGPPGFRLNIEKRRVPPGVRPNMEKRRVRGEKKQFTPVGEPYAVLFKKLWKADLLEPIQGVINPTYKVDHMLHCEFHSGAPGHHIEECYKLKLPIQELIDSNKIKMTKVGPQNIDQDAHKGERIVEEPGEEPVIVLADMSNGLAKEMSGGKPKGFAAI